MTITPDGTMPNPETADQMADDLLTYLVSGGALAFPAWVLSVDNVQVVYAPPT